MSPQSDVGRTILQMKRGAKVETDCDLARFLGRTPSTIALWRKRGAVPEAALLRFEFATAQASA